MELLVGLAIFMGVCSVIAIKLVQASARRNEQGQQEAQRQDAEYQRQAADRAKAWERIVQQQKGRAARCTTKVCDISEHKGWRSLLDQDETAVFDAVAVLRKDGDVQIYILGDDGERKPLGSIAATITFQKLSAKIDPDSEMGRHIKAGCIPCAVNVYRGIRGRRDEFGDWDQGTYSTASTDLLLCLKEAVEAQQKEVV